MISITNLKKYYGTQRGLEHATLSVNEGEIFGFIGPNGSGKTTLIRILMGLLEKTSGDAQIFGMNCTLDQFQINKDIGYLPSEANFFGNYTVKEIIDLYSAFKPVDYTFVEHIIKSLDISLQKKMDELSFGNKKKVGILIALMHQPKLLILDEPTSGLDPLIQNRFLDLLLEMHQKGTTIFLSSHVLSEVQKICDRVAFVKNGEIILVETIDNLKNKQHKVIYLKPQLEIPLEHIKYIKSPNHHGTRFEYHGDVNKLIQTLKNYKLDDLVIQDVSLEDIFLSYYERGDFDV